MVACDYNPSTQEQEHCHEFEAILGYIVSSRQSLATKNLEEKEGGKVAGVMSLCRQDRAGGSWQRGKEARDSSFIVAVGRLSLVGEDAGGRQSSMAVGALSHLVASVLSASGKPGHWLSSRGWEEALML